MIRGPGCIKWFDKVWSVADLIIKKKIGNSSLKIISSSFLSSDSRRNFHIVNASFVDALVLEAVDLDDLESIEGILSWRDVKAKEIGLTDVDKKLLMMQKKAQVMLDFVAEVVHK